MWVLFFCLLSSGGVILFLLCILEVFKISINRLILLPSCGGFGFSISLLTPIPTSHNPCHWSHLCCCNRFPDLLSLYPSLSYLNSCSSHSQQVCHPRNPETLKTPPSTVCVCGGGGFLLLLTPTPHYLIVHAVSGIGRIEPRIRYL